MMDTIIDSGYLKATVKDIDEETVNITITEKITGNDLTYNCKFNHELLSPMEQWKTIFSSMNNLFSLMYPEYEKEATNEPKYYNGNGLSPMTAFKNGLISKDEYTGFIKGNIIKYIVRAGKKDDAIADINKAINYCNFLKEEYLND